MAEKEVNPLQWGLEFRTLEIRTHSKSEPFFVLFPNGSVSEWWFENGTIQNGRSSLGRFI